MTPARSSNGRPFLVTPLGGGGTWRVVATSSADAAAAYLEAHPPSPVRVVDRQRRHAVVLGLHAGALLELERCRCGRWFVPGDELAAVSCPSCLARTSRRAFLEDLARRYS